MKRIILSILAAFAISLVLGSPCTTRAAEVEVPLKSASHDIGQEAETPMSPPKQDLRAGTPGEDLLEKKSQLKSAELPPAISHLVNFPIKPVELVEKNVERKGRPEVLVSGERAGFKRYYQEGRGFKVTDFLSLSGRVELFEDFVPVDSLILAANEQRIRNLNRLELEDTITDDEIRNSYTRATAGTAIMKFKENWPVLRFTYDWRAIFRVFDQTLNGFKELDQETYEHFIEYTIPYQLPVLGRWTINAGYSRILMRSPENKNANEQRNKWTFNNAFQIDKEREIFFQYEYFVSKHEDAPFILKPDQHTFVFQWRQRFPDWRLFSVTNYSVSREAFSPDVALFTKHEIFQEFNKDITEKLRASQRTTFVYGKVANSNFNPDKVYAEAMVGKLKLSYEILKDLDVSMAYQQSWGLNLTEYDNALFLWETEIFKPGLLRTSVGYFWQTFYNVSKQERGIQFRCFVFQ